ncbi:hypothetical protein V6N11_060603 [Hibiscus sabdariffa]|uniref:F-box domain-containing protein n=1 Tax=Hibiscus sabdariffa TaxID=183260 RepID=A0ABR2QQU2_9ROSI
MIAEVKVGNEDLNLCFEKLMMVAAGNTVCKGVKMNGVWITEWKDIPVELLLRIVSLLNDRTAIGASGVCSGWRDAICGVCSGWRDAICFGLARLRLSCCRKNMNSLVLSLAPKFTKLQTLILRQDNPQLEDEAVLTISKFCHDLQDLDLSKSFKLSDCSLYALAHGCPNLKRLNISGCTSFSDEALAYLTDFCRKLKLLNLCGCVNSATGHALQAIGRNCNMLQSLNLGWYYNVGDHGVMSLAYGCPDLRCLDMCGCVCITGIPLHMVLIWHTIMQCKIYRAMYLLPERRMKNKGSMWEPMNDRYNDEDGLKSLKYKPVYGPDSFSRPGIMRFVPCTSYMLRTAFPCHEWLPELNACALCLCRLSDIQQYLSCCSLKGRCSLHFYNVCILLYIKQRLLES